jgi:hypothetical protein
MSLYKAYSAGSLVGQVALQDPPRIFFEQSSHYAVAEFFF